MAGILNIQLKSLMGDKEINLKKVEHYIKFNKDKKLDLVVMPEFFSTNIDYDKSPEDENGGETIKFIQKLAKEYNTNIVAGSVVRKIGDKQFNTSFAIDRNGEIIAKYDKIHLFNYMGGTEGKTISAGDKIAVAHFDFAKTLDFEGNVFTIEECIACAIDMEVITKRKERICDNGCHAVWYRDFGQG